jgi:hypothetical protein
MSFCKTDATRRASKNEDFPRNSGIAMFLRSHKRVWLRVYGYIPVGFYVSTQRRKDAEILILKNLISAFRRLGVETWR